MRHRSPSARIRPYAVATILGKVSVVLYLALGTGCTLVPIRPMNTSIPEAGDGWEAATPQSAGFDEAALKKLTLDLHAGRFPNTHAVLIEHDGRLIYEEYFAGTDERWGQPIGRRVFNRESLHDLRSVSKSVTSLVLGIVLAEEGLSALERPVPTFLPRIEASPGFQGVRLHHALTMTSGIEWNEMTVPYSDTTNDEIRLYGVTDPVALVLKRPGVLTPGSEWIYNGGLSQVLAGIVQERSGKPLDKVASEVLFTPLGIGNFEWLGGPMWNPAMPAAASGLRMRARDVAKIGSVCLHGGKWKSRQIVPAQWVERSMMRHVARAGAWSNGGVWGYGYQFWLGSLPEGQEVAAMKGNGDQNVFILRKENLVVTILAGNYNRFDGMGERLLQRILAARS